MDAYTSFAQVYDLFMDNVPYEKWCDFIDDLLQTYGMEEKIILDLACGTGKMTRIMAAKGYDMIGIDGSAEMLDIAREAEGESCQEIEWDEDEEMIDTTAETADETTGPETTAAESTTTENATEEIISTAAENIVFETTDPESLDEKQKISDYLSELGMEEEYYDHAYQGRQSQTLYLCQDMRELELYGTIGACYCSCNSLNYILEEEELKNIFKLVNNYLFPKGLFIFDINSAYKYEKVLADNTIAETRPEGSFIWDNFYDKESRINEYDLTLFIREDLLYDEWEQNPETPEEDDEIPYYRFRETHLQKSYSLETIRQLLEEAGMEFIAAYDNYTLEPVRRRSEIITVVAREKGKN